MGEPDLPAGVGMGTGRPVGKIEMSAEVAGILEGYTQRRKTAQALALRARIVLGCAAGLSNKAVAARERVTPQTVGKWRRRFAGRGLDGLLDEPRPGVPRKINDATVESVIVQTLESRPSGATHWSTRSMARHSGISTSSVGRIWRAFGLQPHRLETFKLSTDPPGRLDPQPAGRAIAGFGGVAALTKAMPRMFCTAATTGASAQSGNIASICAVSRSRRSRAASTV